MDALRQQVTLVASELEALKTEIVSIKGAHATLHQTTVTTMANHERVIDEQAVKVAAIQERVEGIAKMTGSSGRDGFRKPLIEPKNVTVEVFHGSVAICFTHKGISRGHVI